MTHVGVAHTGSVPSFFGDLAIVTRSGLVSPARNRGRPTVVSSFVGKGPGGGCRRCAILGRALSLLCSHHTSSFPSPLQVLRSSSRHLVRWFLISCSSCELFSAIFVCFVANPWFLSRFVCFVMPRGFDDVVVRFGGPLVLVIPVGCVEVCLFDLCL